MAYLTYTDYQGMGGALTQAAFTRFEFAAGKHIDRLTHERIVNEDPVRDSVKRLAVELIDYLAAVQDIVRSGVLSASNEGVGATYISEAGQRAHIAKLAADYLSGETTNDDYETPLLYAGVDDA